MNLKLFLLKRWLEYYQIIRWFRQPIRVQRLVRIDLFHFHPAASRILMNEMSKVKNLQKLKN